MHYYLKHHFDPSFDRLKLTPQDQGDGSVDHRSLNYVQNVISGQLLAEWENVEDDDVSQYAPRFLFSEKKFPIGYNCRIDPANTDRLLAAADGYVFYLNGTINVKKLLNVRGNVDYHTGNIDFVSDIIVHKNIMSGFEIQGNDVRVYGNVNGAKVRARGSLLVDGGIKGAHQADLQAKGSIRAGFCENAVLRAGKDIILDGVSYHSELYAPRLISIKGRLQGGRVYSRGTVFVEERVGCGMGGTTAIILGFDPALLREGRLLKARIREYVAALELLPEGDADDGSQQGERGVIQGKLAVCKKRQWKVWEAVENTYNPNSRLVVPGVIRPGVEISIGPAHLRIDDAMFNTCFYLKDTHIECVSPALGT